MAWITACKNYMRHYGEPDDLIKAKFDAIRSLSPGLPNSDCPKLDSSQFTWYDFKRGYRIIQIWQERRRLEQTKWETLMDPIENDREEVWRAKVKEEEEKEKRRLEEEQGEIVEYELVEVNIWVAEDNGYGG